MDLAGYVIKAVLVEGRSVKEVCEAHDISRSWLYELIGRYREVGDDGLKPRSKRPHSSPTRVSVVIEDEIVALRKELTDLGVDAGAHTIHYHLQRRHRRRRTAVPSVATIWRVLTRRGFVTPQPQKRPKSSWRRFQAELPNECWQADTTHWALADGTDVEILNVIDDHSRLLVASRAFGTAKAADVVETFHQGASELGLPASMLTDNGAIFTATSRNGTCAIELELLTLGVDYKHSRPYHPQTCGKIERFHQTLKRWLVRQPLAEDLTDLQQHLDRFIEIYNHHRPHRGIGRVTPIERWTATPNAINLGHALPAAQRATRVTIDRQGLARVRPWVIHVGVDHTGRTAHVMVDHTHAAVFIDGRLVRHLELDHSRPYQPSGLTRRRPRRRLP